MFSTASKCRVAKYAVDGMDFLFLGPCLNPETRKMTPRPPHFHPTPIIV